MQVVAGTAPGARNEGIGFFPPGSPSASDLSMAPLTGPRDLAPARAALSGVCLRAGDPLGQAACLAMEEAPGFDLAAALALLIQQDLVVSLRHAGVSPAA